MKIGYGSDLHLDVWNGKGRVGVPPDLDVLVLAGDICPMHVAHRVIPDMGIPVPTVYVAGNHEHYHGQIAGFRETYADDLLPRAHLLENTSIVISGVRFLGCTLWTDYGPEMNRNVNMDLAGRSLNDHRLIRNGDRRWTTDDALEAHRASLEWLRNELFVVGFDGPTVIVTHHAPSYRSVTPKYVGDPLNSAFVSELDILVKVSGAAAWIHGHVHSEHDYMIGDTRVLCNPRGYPLEIHDQKSYSLRVLEIPDQSPL